MNSEAKITELQDGGVYLIQPKNTMNRKEIDEFIRGFKELSNQTGNTWRAVILPEALQFDELPLPELLRIRSQIDKLINDLQSGEPS